MNKKYTNYNFKLQNVSNINKIVNCNFDFVIFL